jgi:hypothetical protein
VITETYGVFVSPSGSDTKGNGSRASPFGTIGRGIAVASARSLRVYVCGTSGLPYHEHVELADGVSVYGGLVCPTGTPADWTYTGAQPLVAPSTPGYALSASALLSATEVSDMAFVTATATGDAGATPAGGTSIAAFLVSSASIALTRVSLTSGDGAPGAAGSTTSNYSSPAAATGNAAEPFGATAGAIACPCADGTSSTGGAGGSSGSPAGVSGTSAPPVLSPVVNGGAVIAGGCQGAPSTQPGANGASGAGGQMGSGPGALSASGWTDAPPSGTAPNGAPGQGGGGGSWDAPEEAREGRALRSWS